MQIFSTTFPAKFVEMNPMVSNLNFLSNKKISIKQIFSFIAFLSQKDKIIHLSKNNGLKSKYKGGIFYSISKF